MSDKIDPLQKAGAAVADAVATATGGTVFYMQFLDTIGSFEKAVIGALTIVMLILRILVHFRPGHSQKKPID